MKGIEHFIVLMLENRSFDHMLGLLDHPKKADFPQAFLEGKDTRNPVEGGADAEMKQRYQGQQFYMTGKKPGHSHKDVMSQMFDQSLPGDPSPGMRGFAMNYIKEKGARKADDVMRAYGLNEAPVINTLAKHFQLCTNWFCSVPGETWPNRFFAMAGESAGHVGNAYLKVPFKLRDTIFPLLQNKGINWRIYHDGICLAMLIDGMLKGDMKQRYSNTDKLIDDIGQNSLPAFSWVEPDHFGKDSSSQHPGFIDKKHDAWGFISADNLIAKIYDALADNSALFEKTLFLVTYDEHGGFYDHVSPPNDFTKPYNSHINENGFDFRQLGPRVPALLINPRITEASIDDTQYDHSAILKMVERLFLDPDAENFKSARVKNSANPLLKIEDSGSAGNIPPVTNRLVADDRPPDWKLRLADHLDDLQISLMKAVLKLKGGAGAVANILTTKGLAISETERRHALLADYIAHHEGRHAGLAVNKLLGPALHQDGDNVVDLMHDLSDSLLGKELAKM